MGRRSRPALLPWIKGANAVCDNCGGCGHLLMEVGIPCYHCKDGVLIGAEAWDFWPCPANCHMRDPFCDGCGGRAFVSTPREDLPLAKIIEIWRALPGRYERRGEAVPELVLERLRWADLSDRI